MHVTVTPNQPAGPRRTGATKGDGFAEFWLPRNAEYSIEVESPGFKRRRIEGVMVGPVLEHTSTTYVQVQLQVDSPKVTIE
jgi:hypothetical protein